MIVADATWKIKHSWAVRPNRSAITKALAELKEALIITVQLDLCSKVYLVADELLRNSMEHGCFKIGKVEKARLLGLGTYEELLTQLEKTSDDKNTYWIELSLEIESAKLLLSVRDSGEGYDLKECRKNDPDLTRLSNRGLDLIKGFSSKIDVSRTPTQTTVTFDLG